MSARVVVLGGGVVGLSCADELARAGHAVTVLDPAPGGGATHAAAGMLAPAGEAWFGEEALLRLGLDSAARWPAWAASLEHRAGRSVGLRTTGTVLVAADRDDLVELRRALELLAASAVVAEPLDRRGLRRREPTLSAHVAGGAFLPDDHQVDPRRVTTALLAVLGDRVVRRRGRPVARGVETDDGTVLACDVVVLATGTQGVPHVRPVRGEIIRVRSEDPPHHVVRGRVRGRPVYAVPRADGEVVIGATVEEHPAADEPRPTLGGTLALLDAARELLPGLATAELAEVVARDRPGSPDNGPLVGPLPAPGDVRHVVAGGHHRGGVLLAPVTAAAVRAWVEDDLGRDVPAPARAFTPARFSAGPQEDPPLQ